MTGKGQLGLFGTDTELPPREPDPELVELASGLPPRLRFGTCSWTFRGWAGQVYHRSYSSQKSFVGESLSEYVRHPLFRSVEIDRSYYAPVSAEDLAVYADRMPADFDAGMKIWQELTTMIFPRHPRFGERAGKVNPHFLDPHRLAEHVLGPVGETFAGHIGPLLLSIPPGGAGADPGAFEERLGYFLARAPSGYRYAVELRDRQLLTRRYLAILRDHGATHVLNHWSRMPPISEQVRMGALTGPFVVARLMLPHGARYQQLKDEWAPFDRIAHVDDEMRTDVLAMIRDAAERDMPTYVYVNNKAEGSAPLTIRALAEALQ
ncbi:MAG: DUF72 domain-containing protein [Deltaproteobacteria bacterium]|nr:DUF72 domain-containing protein [Deltaproteobacteria bacterium]